MARTENELKNLMNEKSKKEREYLQSKLKGNSECKRITLKEEIINEYKNGNLTLEEILEEKELNGSIIDVVRFYASWNTVNRVDTIFNSFLGGTRCYSY